MVFWVVVRVLLMYSGCFRVFSMVARVFWMF